MWIKGEAGQGTMGRGIDNGRSTGTEEVLAVVKCHFSGFAGFESLG
jgi:hypothetical protein